jgi:hypothetical protein
MSATKTPDENFLQNMSNEIETKANRTHLYQMRNKKNKKK